MTLIAARALRSALTAFALSLFLSPAPGWAQERQQSTSPGAMSERWETLREDAGGLFGNLFGRSDRAQADRLPHEERPTVVAQMSAGDLMVRLDRLENQIRQLTGAVEQLQFRNQQLEQQVRRSQEDLEYRFQEQGGKGAPARPRPAAQPPQPAPGAIAPGRRSDVFDPAENPAAPGAPQTLGAIPAYPSGPPPIIEEEPGIGAPGGRAAGAPLDLATLADRAAHDPTLAAPGASPPVAALPPPALNTPLPPPPPRNPNATGAPQQTVMAPSATPKDEFALAHGYIQRRDYALAEEGLRAFLKKHPNDRLVSDAHYWLGESLYQRQRYRDAAESFLTVSTKFEKSGKAPEALLRLGQSLAALGEREAACATLAEVVRKYPAASPGVKQGVEREQKRDKC